MEHKSCQNRDNFDYVKIFAAALCWTLVIYFFIWHLNYFIGVDAYYHIKIAEIMRDHGLVLNGFPWADCSIWRDNFFDKDWLFHIYLIPFTLFGKLLGGKLAILTAVFLICFSWGVLLKSLKIKHIFLSLIIMLSCYGFYSRLFMCRGHLLSIAFFPLCLACIIKRKQILLFLLTLIYSLAYAGSWQILPLAILFDLLTLVMRKEEFFLKKSVALPVLLGIIISIFINPYFPNNVNGLIIQNFFVLKTKWFGNGNVIINLGREFNPLTSRKLYTWYLLFIILLFVTIGNFFKDWKEKDKNTIYFGLLIIFYFLLSVISVKFTDYSVPIGFAFIALFWDKWLSDKEYRSRRNIPKGIDSYPLHRLFRIRFKCLSFRKNNLFQYKLIVYCLYCFLFIFIFLTVKNYSNRDAEYQRPLYSGATEWLRHNLSPPTYSEMNPQQIVFTGGWDDAPMLFYGAPHYKYLVFLDPCFMYAFSSDKYLKWQRIVEGKTLYPAMEIHKEFNADLVFLSRRRKGLAEMLEQSPYAKLCYTGENGEKIFKISIGEKQLKDFESTFKTIDNKSEIGNIPLCIVKDEDLKEEPAYLTPEIIIRCDDIGIFYDVLRSVQKNHPFSDSIDLIEKMLSSQKISDKMKDAVTKKYIELEVGQINRLLNENNNLNALSLFNKLYAKTKDNPEVNLIGIKLLMRLNDFEGADYLLNNITDSTKYNPQIAELKKELNKFKEKSERRPINLNETVVSFPVETGSIQVSAVINDIVVQDFILDTGATLVTLPSSTLEELGIHIMIDSPVHRVSTAGGIILAKEVEVDSINLGGCTVENLKVLVLDLPGHPDKGLLGMNFLKHFQVEIDHKKGTITMISKEE